MTSTSYFWHDYETFGIDPQCDRASQFAGIRTDLDFNPIAEPISIFCQPAADYLPHPEACLLTGITPQQAEASGVCEASFIRLINEQLSQPGTCALGYNSLRFDDEVTRNLLYRNFYDPYAREWQNDCSRWDVIDLLRATRALRPEGIHWPVDEQGNPSFRLELLTAANGISHEHAHDALSDVYATLSMAKLIKNQQPKLFDYFFQHKHKSKVQDLLNLGSYTPLVHVSGRFPAKNNCLAIVLPLCYHPSKNNEVIVYDLMVDPKPLLSLSATEIQQRVFVATDQLAEGVSRIPLKTIHINKCPILAPISVIRPQDEQRLGLNRQLYAEHAAQIKAAPALAEKLAEVFYTEYPNSPTDPDLMIYSGGFFNAKDKNTLLKLRLSPPEQLAHFKANFADQRLPEMLFRYRGRNFPETLNATEKQQWQQFCWQRLNNAEPGKTLCFSDYFAKIKQLQSEKGEDNSLLQQLLDYGQQLQVKLGGG